MNDFEKNLIGSAINTITDGSIRDFAWRLAEDLPKYIWEVGASSTAKYHPSYTLGKYGLVKHMIAVVRFLNHMFTLEQYKNQFSPKQMDLLRVAGLFHDGLKSGTDEDFKYNKYTKHEHPILMAEKIMTYKEVLPESDLIYIADAIKSHMGEWNMNNRSNVVLPKPITTAQQILHLADYLASRKDLIIDFPEFVEGSDNSQNINESVVQTETVETHIITIGKYRGRTWKDVEKCDSSYLSWAVDNITYPSERVFLDTFKN